MHHSGRLSWPWTFFRPMHSAPVDGGPDRGAPVITLVACTRNRAVRLEPFFESVRALRCAKTWEIILVDSASDDTTREVLDRSVSTFDVSCCVVRAPQKGLGRARNVGWRMARAPIVAFIDDDCYPAADFLNQVLTCFAEDHRLGVLGGRVELFDVTDLPVTIKTSMVREDYAPRQVIRAGAVHGANMAFRTDALKSINGFDDGFGAGTPFPCEDVDAVARVLLSGWSGAYDPRPVVAHHHGRKTPEEFDRLMEGYDAGRGAFLCKMTTRGAMQYAWHWMRRVRYEPIAVTGRELRAAVRYLTRSPA